MSLYFNEPTSALRLSQGDHSAADVFTKLLEIGLLVFHSS